MISLEDYHAAIAQFVDTASKLGQEDVISVLLYGSAARGSICPGVSDLLDGAIVFSDASLCDEGRFGQLLDGMVNACRGLEQTGIPFHPFHYYGAEELQRHHLAVHLGTWRSDRTSSVLHGLDLRAAISSSDQDLTMTASSFFGNRRNAQRLPGLTLAEKEDEDLFRRSVHGCIKQFTRHQLLLACFACGRVLDQNDAPEVILRLFPQLSGSDIDTLWRAAKRPAGDLQSSELRELTALTMLLNEQLHDLVASWIDTHPS